MMQPGTQLALEWRARLAEHLGHFRIEPVRSRAAAIMADRTALAALNAIGALLVTLLPEREPNRSVYDRTVALADALAAGTWDWPARYAHWELALLAALGFGLDLSAGGATGVTEDLVFVSPRTGRAVSHDAGGAWADKLLPLPAFLIGRGAVSIGAVREALRMTGYFLEHRACPALGARHPARGAGAVDPAVRDPRDGGAGVGCILVNARWIGHGVPVSAFE